MSDLPTRAEAHSGRSVCADLLRCLLARGAPPAEPEPEAQFEQFQATHLYCSTCRRSMPTKERLLLTLPSGDLYGYTCAHCGTDVGTKTATNRPQS